MHEKTPISRDERSAGQIRARLEQKYARYLPHFRRLAQPEPLPLREDKEAWSLRVKSVAFLQELEDDDRFTLITICKRLVEPINDRLTRLVVEQEKTHWVESPTNAKQTRRAIDQIDNQLKELDREDDPYELLSELREVREHGGFNTATYKFEEPTTELRARIDAQIAVIEAEPKISARERSELEERRTRYKGWLPENRK